MRFRHTLFGFDLINVRGIKISADTCIQVNVGIGYGFGKRCVVSYFHFSDGDAFHLLGLLEKNNMNGGSC